MNKKKDNHNYGLVMNKNVLNVESLVFYSVGKNKVEHYLFVDIWGDKIVKTKEVSLDHWLFWLDLKI